MRKIRIGGSPFTKQPVAGVYGCCHAFLGEKHGADVNSVTSNGDGGFSPYNIALRSLSAEHLASQHLLGMGAVIAASWI